MLKALLWISVSLFGAVHEAEVMSVVESKHLFIVQVSQLASLDGGNRNLIKICITRRKLGAAVLFILWFPKLLISETASLGRGNFLFFTHINQNNGPGECRCVTSDKSPSTYSTYYFPFKWMCLLHVWKSCHANPANSDLLTFLYHFQQGTSQQCRHSH